ncbi:MAG: IS1380 family transposase, partial [Dermatophilaceae bacterium]
MSAVFDDPNLVSSAGLVPVLALAESAGLRGLADEHLSVPTDKGANPGLKVASLVAGMVTGADSIGDLALLRHGGMGPVFANAYAPSTLGSFLRA